MPITRLTVFGFKSIATEQSIEVRPLTLLAGANSSGKSSMMQPLLMLKQTLEAPFDPGPLLLSGPNARFTSADQLLSRSGKSRQSDSFAIGLTLDSGTTFTLCFKRQPKKGLVLDSMRITLGDWEGRLREGMTSEEIQQVMRGDPTLDSRSGASLEAVPLTVVRDRCFLRMSLKFDRHQLSLTASLLRWVMEQADGRRNDPVKRAIRGVIHVPGLRGNPERLYPVTAVGADYPGTFENYVASVIAHWEPERLEGLSEDMARLGLTWKVVGRSVNDAQIEILVGRRFQAARGGAHDLVNIADVGFGVSQTLPVVVALHAAEPGQMVYLEQPEIHLHPRAQWAMAHVLAAATRRGAVLVVETHSALLLRGIQTLVARDELDPDSVRLHWFTRDLRYGHTEIHGADLDKSGAFGDWPADFDDVTLDAEGAYLDAVERAAGSRC